MLDLILSGCNGRMGRVLEALCADQPDLHIAAGFDILGNNHRDLNFTYDQPISLSEGDVLTLWVGVPKEN